MDQDKSSLKSFSSNDYVLVNSDSKVKASTPPPTTTANLPTSTPIGAKMNTEQINDLNETINQEDAKNAPEEQNTTPSPTTTEGSTSTIKHSLSDLQKSQNCVIFYGVKYLGCASVNAPKSENEINRIMHTLNEQETATSIEVIMSVPNSIEGSIQLFDTSSECEIASYKMSQVLFVVRGAKNTTESNCFAFTTCHGESLENLIFPCHVFRVNLNDAISKILYSFWVVFKRQQMLQQPAAAKPSQNGDSKPAHTPLTQTSSGGSLTSAASSLFTSFYSSQSQNSVNQNLAEQAAKFVNAPISSQFIFRSLLDIKEDDSKSSNGSTNGVNSQSNFVSVPRDKEFFKLRRNCDKSISVSIQQLSNRPLEIQRCFGVLLCAGRNCNASDMQLLDGISMSKSGSNSYLITAYWNPREPSFAILNEETAKNMRVFLTIAIDLVIEGIQEPVRFSIETKSRVFPQNEKFWVSYNRTKFTEDFYVQIKEGEANSKFHLHSIYSQTELMRKISTSKQANESLISNSNNSDEPDDNGDNEDEFIFSGMGSVKKDLNESELESWVELMQRWHKSINERPKGLQQLVRKGIPDALRGEVWQLLAGCIDDEKHLHESYRLLIVKESPAETVILRDVNRTFPGHVFFQDENGQQALYKICKAYAIYDDEIGYCQGLSFLIATLLLHMPEEQAFNLLVKIMFHYQIRDIYKMNFENLHLRFYQLEMMLHEFLPELYEHFLDLNIETHMYASQWFLTLYTAKFPLYMVYRIIDLFLLHGVSVLFSIGIALLKAAQRDLLALDFEGVLKYFRLGLPKKYRNETSFEDLIEVWSALAPKISEKKLKKLEKNYLLMREVEQLKEEPLVRLDRQCKKLTQTIRRLELENDDMTNELIESKIQLRKLLDEARDQLESTKMDFERFKSEMVSKNADNEDTIERYAGELDTVKGLWRSQTERYEFEVERQQTIINEYKNICNKLSMKIERYQANLKAIVEMKSKFSAIECNGEAGKEFSELYSMVKAGLDGISIGDGEENGSSPFKVPVSASFGVKNEESLDKGSEMSSSDKIKQLELELARVKLELVDSQCQNQEYKHKLKQYQQFSDSNSNEQISVQGNNNLSASNSSLNSSAKNSWFTKTITQFKEAKNQVAQKVKSSNFDIN